MRWGVAVGGVVEQCACVKDGNERDTHTHEGYMQENSDKQRGTLLRNRGKKEGG